MSHLDGTSALVTGAAGGIGAACAARLAADGAAVVGVDRHAPSAPPAGVAQAVLADVADAEAMAGAVAAACALAPLSVCVANAGVLLIEELLDGEPAHWQEVLRVNAIGTMTTLRAAARAMVAAGSGGRLVATASIAGLRGEAGSPAYSASKAAVVNLVESLALELAPHAITVNAIAPGEVDTAMHRDAMERLGAARGIEPDALREQVVAGIPLGRMATPDDVAGVVSFLASPDAAYLTGLTIRVDGGQLLL